jgi:dihydroneopterin aldolase
MKRKIMTTPLARSVFLEEIEVICSIGLHDFERAEKQRVLIDVELMLASDREPSADNVGETLNYDDVRDAVIRIAEARHYDLQETLARSIFDHIRGMRDVTGLMIQTQKPDVYPNCKTVAYRLSDITPA